MAKDVLGKEIKTGQLIARAVSMNRGGSAEVVVAVVTRIDPVADKIYLDNSKQPIKFPERLAIIS